MRLLIGGPSGDGPIPLPTGSGPFIGTVESIGSPKAGQQNAVVRLDGDTAHPSILIAAQLPGFPEIAPADRIRLSGSIEAPGPDSYGDYLRRIGIDGSVRARSLDRLEAPFSPEGLVSSMRSTAGDALSLAIPEPEAGLAAGILVGLRDRVDRDLAAAYTTAGLSHVIAMLSSSMTFEASMTTPLSSVMVSVV